MALWSWSKAKVQECGGFSLVGWTEEIHYAAQRLEKEKDPKEGIHAAIWVSVGDEGWYSENVETHGAEEHETAESADQFDVQTSLWM